MTSNDSRTNLSNRRSYLKGCVVGIGSALVISGSGSASQTTDERPADCPPAEVEEPDDDSDEPDEAPDDPDDDPEPEPCEESVDPDVYEDHYDTIIDVVEAGADPTGNESITHVLRNAVGDDTLLTFPEGRYYMDEQLRLTSFNNVGFLGENATIVPAAYSDVVGSEHRLFRLGTHSNPGRNLWFQGFTIDQTAPGTGTRVLNAEVEDGLLVRNVYINGVHDSGTWGPGLFNVLDPSGRGLVDCFHASDGGLHVDETPHDGQRTGRGASGIHVNDTRGSLVFRDCVLGGFPGSGLYASTDRGEIGVEGGTFKNSTTASLRLAGERASVTGAAVTVDENPERAASQHPIRLDHGSEFMIDDVEINMPRPNGDAIRIMNDVDRTWISNTQISIGERKNSGIRVNANAGPTEIENVDIEIDGSGYAFQILGQDGGEVSLQDVTITGDADGSPLRHTIYCERNGCRFHDVSIDQPGEGRGGLELRGDDYHISGGEYRTSHVPIVVNGSDNVLIEDCYSNSYEDRPSLRIISDSGTVDLSDNEFPGGVRDDR